MLFRSLKPLTLSLLSASILVISGCQTLGLTKDKQITEQSTPTESEAGYYADAVKALKKDRLETAEQNLRDLRTFYPIGVHAEEALLALIYVDYRQGDYPEVIKNTERFVSLYPTSPEIDYALYIKGVSSMTSGVGSLMRYTELNLAHRDVGYLRAAYQDLGALVNQYPQSPYAPDAIDRMYYIYNAMAEHEMNAARWYLRREAYLASLERGRWVFQYYPQSMSVPEAMAIMQISHEKLGNTQTAQQYRDLIAANYPALIQDGKIEPQNARVKGSLLNRATLGIAGEPERPRLFPAPKAAGKTQSIMSASALRTPPGALPPADAVTDAPTPGVLVAPPVNFGLGLPSNDPTDNVSDPSSEFPVTAPINPNPAIAR